MKGTKDQDDFLDDVDDSDLDDSDLDDETMLRAMSGAKKINWQRIENIRDQLALKAALSDFDDYRI
jgi:hypothetical protein